jgi:hypothetical protein
VSKKCPRFLESLVRPRQPIHRIGLDILEPTRIDLPRDRWTGVPRAALSLGDQCSGHNQRRRKSMTQRVHVDLCANPRGRAPARKPYRSAVVRCIACPSGIGKTMWCLPCGHGASNAGALPRVPSESATCERPPSFWAEKSVGRTGPSSFSTQAHESERRTKIRPREDSLPVSASIPLSSMSDHRNANSSPLLIPVRYAVRNRVR